MSSSIKISQFRKWISYTPESQEKEFALLRPPKLGLISNLPHFLRPQMAPIPNPVEKCTFLKEEIFSKRGGRNPATSGFQKSTPARVTFGVFCTGGSPLELCHTLQGLVLAVGTCAKAWVVLQPLLYMTPPNSSPPKDEQQTLSCTQCQLPKTGGKGSQSENPDPDLGALSF